MPIGTPMAHNGVPAKTVSVTIKLTPEQYKFIDQKSKKCGVRVAVWMRSILCHAATRQPDIDGYIRIREPDGVTT
jgi:hypothetical protein